jgi:SAM-dependent methyltransferase
VEIDPRVTRRYEKADEDARLWEPGRGDLVRLRTWDIFERYLPLSGRVLDVGGGPGTHAAHLAGRGYDVTLVDPVPRHVELASRRAGDPATAAFVVRLAGAHDLPVDDGSVDAVLLMGPLYHLIDRSDRLAALAEARRALRPGGRLLAEIIGRHTWALDATLQMLLDSPKTWADIERTVAAGLTQDPASVPKGSFWAYFHRLDELRDELATAGFDGVSLVAVEGFAWLLPDLAERMTDPEPLLRVVRLTETEPSLLGCSAHVIGVANRP